jgi:hypothetical protein
MLSAYPARFRREYGDGMLEAFRDLRRHTARGPLGFWLFLIADTARAGAAHAQAGRELLRSSRCRWITACAIGATACGGLGSLATWAFSYFYYPYLEGTAFVPIMTSACCAALGVEVAISLARVAGPLGYAVAFGSIVEVRFQEHQVDREDQLRPMATANELGRELAFNGYGDQVASMYEGMDLRRFY